MLPYQRRLLATLIGNALIAAFLTALDVGGGWVVNLLVSQSIGLSILSTCSLAAWMIPEGRWRTPLIVAAVPFGTTIGLLIGVSLSGIGWIEWTPLGWQAVAIGTSLGTMGSGFFYLRERNLALAAEVQKRENRRLEAEKQSLAAQLRMLQAQIEPHFLFNSLANVTALIEREPQLASRLLDALIRYLRSSLSRARAEGGTLGDELGLLTAYLDVLKIRMGERLNYTFEIDPDLRAYEFPPMLLQPLVENAIRHGLEPKVGGGHLNIRAQKIDNCLRISVRDDGVGFSGTSGSGFGVSNVKARLLAIYGPTAQLDLLSKVGAGVTATLSLPVEIPL